MPHVDRRTTPTLDEGRYRLLVEAIVDYAIYMLTPDGAIASWNAGARRIEGYEAHEVVGRPFARLYSAEDQKKGLPQQALATAQSSGRYEHEGWGVRKDGQRFWSHVVIDPIIDPAGELLGYAKITRDLTERWLAESALRRSEEQFRLLVRSVTDYAIYMLDPNGIVTNWNLGAQRIKGYLPGDVIGQHFSLFFTDEDRASGEPQQELETAIRDGRSETQGWRVRKDGTRFWASVVMDAIHRDDGSLLGFAKITRDVTEARDAQMALEQAKEALFQSQKIESLGQLTGGIAHDFNNLLMVIQGSLQLIHKRVDDPKVLTLLDYAIQSVQRGAALTQRMLAFARRQELKLELIDVPSLVRDMAELLQRSLGSRITIETRFPLQLKPVLADSNQLEMALLNLAVNARDAMPEGGTIIIAASELQVINGRDGLTPGAFVCLSLSDSGHGMDEATLKRAQEPFFTTKGVGKGTGLGLSMVYGLAEQSGGKLLLRSQVDHGTTAELWLPVANEALPSAEPVIATAVEVPLPSGLQVLVVDDDPLVLLSTAAMLEDLGCVVAQASSGADALLLIGHSHFDLVITDQVMPNMTGRQLAREIRQVQPQLPILLATGFTEKNADPSQEKLPRLGKPFDQTALARGMRRVLGLSNVAR